MPEIAGDTAVGKQVMKDRTNFLIKRNYCYLVNIDYSAIRE